MEITALKLKYEHFEFKQAFVGMMETVPWNQG